MSTVSQKYLKDENGNIFSPITGINSIYLDDGRGLGNSCLVMKRAIADGEDFNTIVTCGIYYYKDTTNNPNAPSADLSWSYLYVTSFKPDLNSAVTQIVVCPYKSKIAIRDRTSQEKIWSAWKIITI